jgi:hypothetical protein
MFKAELFGGMLVEAAIGLMLSFSKIKRFASFGFSKEFYTPDAPSGGSGESRLERGCGSPSLKR